LVGAEAIVPKLTAPAEPAAGGFAASTEEHEPPLPPAAPPAVDSVTA